MTYIKMPTIGMSLPPGYQNLIRRGAVFKWKVDLWIDIVDPAFLHPFYTIRIELPIGT
ncbi:hypothetical protein D3C81_1259540 [compost metagenome]